MGHSIDQMDELDRNPPPHTHTHISIVRVRTPTCSGPRGAIVVGPRQAGGSGSAKAQGWS